MKSIFKTWTAKFFPGKPTKRRHRKRPGRRGRGARLEQLERRNLLAVDIVFDYSYDDAGFFDTEAKAALERAAVDYESRLLDTLSAIPAPTGGNSWTASFQDPETGSTVNLPNLQLAENEVRVFVGSRDITGTTLGKASSGYGVQYTDDAWLNTVLWRGQTGENEQSTWGGSIAFDTTPTWHFGEGLPTSGTSDLYSVALHELGHIFGISNQAGNTWTNYASALNELSPADQALVNNQAGDYFTGPKAVALYGSPIPVSGGHFDHDISYAGAEAALDPNLTTGTRKPMSPLDWTTLDDIGWDIGTRFVSGTVFDDSVVDNDQPDAGEGEAGLTVTATNTTTNAEYTTTTHTDGTYALELPPGTYDLVFTGGGHEGYAETTGIDLTTDNSNSNVNSADITWTLSQPTVPDNLTITATSPTTASISWIDSQNESSYEIYHWNAVSKIVTKAATLSANSTSYEATGLSPGTNEWFMVKAANDSGTANTSWTQVTIPPQAATAPENLTVTANDATVATISWTDSQNESSYEVYHWNRESNNVTLISTLSANATSYQATGLSPGVSEWFLVKAINSSGSASTTWRQVIMPLAAPTVPGSLTVTADNPTTATVTWTDSQNESSYEVYHWNRVSNSVTKLATLSANSTYFQATGLSAGTSEWFMIKAINGPESANTGWHQVVMPNPAITVPGSVAVTADSPTTATISWTDSQNESSYEVYHWNRESNNVTQIATLSANTTSYQATGLSPGASEWFLIKAINGSETASTAWHRITMPFAVPTAPSNPTVTATSPTTATISWTDSQNESNYEIYHWNAVSKVVLKIATLGADVSSYEATNLSPGVSEWFSIKAINGPESASTAWQRVVMQTS